MRMVCDTNAGKNFITEQADNRWLNQFVTDARTGTIAILKELIDDRKGAATK